MKTKIALCSMLLCCTLFFSCRKLETDVILHNANVASSIQTNAPNIIVILADDFGYELPTYTGGQSYQTPNLDALAASGMQFTQCRALPLCSPSRFQLMTGKYNFRNYTTWGILDPTEMTFAKLLRDNGYETCISGKWQLDGGDNSIQSLGFNSYSVAMPFIAGSEQATSPIENYKNPTIYERSTFSTEAQTKDKYGEDIFRNYMLRFIKKNKNNKFLVYWTPNLVHKPFCPTPDDAAFTTWNNKNKQKPGDTIYFPSMVKYLDKEIGILRDSLASLNLLNNTLILFVGDNGTHPDITSMYNGQPFRGGKSFTVEAGIHVPMIASMPGTIAAGISDSSLIDFTDFFVSLADFTGISTAGIDSLDGVSFAPQLKGLQATPRQFSYGWYNGNTKKSTENPLLRYVNNSTYKLYKSEAGVYSFYNFQKDPLEQNPILLENLTPEETTIRESMLTMINRYQ